MVKYSCLLPMILDIAILNSRQAILHGYFAVLTPLGYLQESRGEGGVVDGEYEGGAGQKSVEANVTMSFFLFFFLCV